MWLNLAMHIQYVNHREFGALITLPRPNFLEDVLTLICTIVDLPR
jgi:hypothetical protein